MNDVRNAYLACWNQTDSAVRRRMVDEIFAADFTYTDPVADVAGRDSLDSTIAAVQQQFPGFVFTAIGAVDAHHRQLRFQWGLGPAGAEPPIVGFDVAVVDADGKVATVLGFLDKVPS